MAVVFHLLENYSISLCITIVPHSAEGANRQSADGDIPTGMNMSFLKKHTLINIQVFISNMSCLEQ